MWNIASFNFTIWDARRFGMAEAKRRIDLQAAEYGIDSVVFIVCAQQDHCYSTDIDWKGPHMLGDADLVELFRHAASKGLKRIMKPMLNPRDGYWRAFIRFFDEDVPCEPKWGDWFRNYSDYIAHYAELCAAEGVEMLIAGCELVGTDHREAEWRSLIARVRSVYSGLVTYNCDKYQEHNVAWWDACDAISSSGYYPVDDWPRQIDRIARTVRRFDKPFFFSEVGCPSTEGAAMVPNDWTAVGKRKADQAEQERFFRTMFDACRELPWHYGYCIWDWPAVETPAYDPATDGGYSVDGKAAGRLLAAEFRREGRNGRRT